MSAKHLHEQLAALRRAAASTGKYSAVEVSISTYDDSVTVACSASGEVDGQMAHLSVRASSGVRGWPLDLADVIERACARLLDEDWDRPRSEPAPVEPPAPSDGGEVS